MSDLPSVVATTDPVTRSAVDAVVVPVFRGAIEGPGAEELLQGLGLEGVFRDATFAGRAGQVLHLAAPGLPAGRVSLVGLGRMDELTDEQLRRAAGAATAALRADAASVATTLVLTKPSAGAVRAVVEGALLGAYRYDRHRTSPRPRRLSTVTVEVPSSLGHEAGRLLHRATLHARAQTVARDLVNTPPGDKRPPQLAERAAALLQDTLEVEVWGEQRLERERCQGVLAVGRGSDSPPRMLLARHRPREPIARVALVGKGITFDTGGLSLKRPNEHMVWMKVDMAGAAAVIGALSVLSELGIPVEVLGICPLAENMPSGAAQRPGDVYRARNGTTVEVLNTDAEGRLALSDALSYAAEQDLDAIVDLATLTGAALRAVGRRATALFGNDDDLLRQLLAAAEEAGEATWHMPLWDELDDNLESEVADVDNMGRGDEAGATMAGLFLRRFVGGAPWAHLDIAGAAWGEEARFHLPKQGTGTGARTILRWLEQAAH